jgi:hypothetical protein
MLTVLDCDFNKLIELPPLPCTIQFFSCIQNPMIYPPPDVVSHHVDYIREWMSENPRPSTYIKSAYKV